MTTLLQKVADRALETWNSTLDLPHSTRMALAIEAGLRHAGAELAATRCTCPVGFGQIADPNCERHGNRAPAHTITGAQP